MKYVEWVDPWPAANEDFSDRTAACHHKMTVEDAICVQRAYHIKMMEKRPDLPMLSSEKLLDEFIVVNWATIVEVPDANNQ